MDLDACNVSSNPSNINAFSFGRSIIRNLAFTTMPRVPSDATNNLLMSSILSLNTLSILYPHEFFLTLGNLYWIKSLFDLNRFASDSSNLLVVELPLLYQALLPISTDLVSESSPLDKITLSDRT